MRLGVWESVWLTNLLALPLFAALAYVRGIWKDSARSSCPCRWGMVLCCSCRRSWPIGYAGWLCRGLVSATSYTLIGVANKLGTVLLAIAFLDKHASPLGVLALVCCIAASSQYKQSPLRAEGPGRAKAQGAGDGMAAALPKQ